MIGVSCSKGLDVSVWLFFVFLKFCRKFCFFFSLFKMSELLDVRFCVLKILKIIKLFFLEGVWIFN